MKMFFPLCLAFLFTTCQVPTVKDPDEQEPTREDPSRPADDPDQDGYVSVPLKSAVTQVQPMTGIVVWEDSDNGRKRSWVTLEFAYMLYNEVCKEKDVFDWTPMERLLESVASRGHQAVVRFRYAYPGLPGAVPDYIKELDGYEGITYKAEDGKTEYPDWRCEELQRFHMEFHRRFAEQYDTDPRLAFLETGFGHWAEYHVYGGKFIPGQTFPSMGFQTEFLQAMDGWFRHTPWMISIDAADPSYAPFHSRPALLNLGFGNFDDSFMCKDHDDYNLECWEFFGKERYKRAPLGGEFSYYSGYDQKHCLDKDGMYDRIFEDEVAKFHMTFIIGNDQPGKQTDERIEEAALSMGYRFRIEAFSIKPGTGARIRVSNTGVAPIYRDAYLALDGTRADYSLRSLMPGESAEVLIPLHSATPQSVLTIESDAILSTQTIQFDAELE